MLGAADSAGGGAGKGGADLAPADLKEAAGLPTSSCVDGGGHGERWNARSECGAAEGKGGILVCVGFLSGRIC